MSRPLVPGLVAEGDTDEVFLGRVIARQLRALTDFAPRPKVLAGIAHREVGEYFAFAGDHVSLETLAQLPAYGVWVEATTRVLRSEGFL
ncbi:hypothetical protein ACQEUU_32240 [Nonomuraea sp. CA-218870]|uniref:hypothetical protein n=1 Tax=Nonomuraea sp. CA-218870 TaxID=3239998 RepID=UPI003D8FD4F0